MSYLFTSESVSEGHPDKVCDIISDNLTDLYLNKNNNSRTAIEVLATTNQVIIAGETNCPECIEKDEIEHTVRQTIKNIGYTQSSFNWKNVNIQNFLHQQSSDIARGVDIDGAGDQGIMFGYAKDEETSCCHEYMPLAICLSHRILFNLAKARHNDEIKGIEPDSKSQVTVEYDQNKKPTRIKSVVLSTQHQENLSQEEIHAIAKKYIYKSLPQELELKDQDILINPTGRFVIGGPDGDTGLTGRKIVVDTYGGYAPHGGGAFSGKDPTKVDRSAAYMLRYLAKNICAAGLAKECLLQISYAIGVKDPLSFYINCNKTNHVDEQKILKTIKEMVDLTPKGIINHLNLNRPIYTPTASYGHFGKLPQKNGSFSWEKLDLVEELKKCF